MVPLSFPVREKLKRQSTIIMLQTSSGRSSPAPPGAARLHSKAQATPLREALGCSEGGRQIVVSETVRELDERRKRRPPDDAARARAVHSPPPPPPKQP